MRNLLCGEVALHFNREKKEKANLYDLSMLLWMGATSSGHFSNHMWGPGSQFHRPMTPPSYKKYKDLNFMPTLNFVYLHPFLIFNSKNNGTKHSLGNRV